MGLEAYNGHRGHHRALVRADLLTAFITDLIWCYTGEQDTKTTENATDGQKATAKSNVGGAADRANGRHGSSNATAGSRYPHHPRPRETEEVLMRRRVFVGNMSRQVRCCCRVAVVVVRVCGQNEVLL